VRASVPVLRHTGATAPVDRTETRVIEFVRRRRVDALRNAVCGQGNSATGVALCDQG